MRNMFSVFLWVCCPVHRQFYFPASIVIFYLSSNFVVFQLQFWSPENKRNITFP